MACSSFKVAIGFLVASLISLLLAWSSSLEGRPDLGRVLVVPYAFLLLLLSGRIRDRVHNAAPLVFVHHQCLHVRYVMLDIPCYTVDVVQWPSFSGWARQSQADHVRYNLVFGTETVTSKTCSAMSCNGRNGWYVSVDLCFCSVFPPSDVLNSHKKPSICAIKPVLQGLLHGPCL